MLGISRRGTVYGTLLNHRDALAALGDAVHAPPYKAPPRAPVLYIKPRNTWVADGDAVVVPAGVDELEIGATLGLVLGRSACKVDASEAMGHVAGCVIVCDVCVPHASVYRPSLRYRARDTFCPIGAFVPLAEAGAPDAVQLAVAIDGEVVQRVSLRDLVRGPAALLAEISAFMTLAPGDVLTLGVAAGAPRACAGQRVSISAAGFETLSNPLVAEAPQREAA